MHDCFTRELKDGARPIDAAPDILVSPCDAIVGACGAIAGTELYQAKGFPYTLEDLLGDRDLVEAHRNGRYVTLRLTSSMYHRFHAPHDCRIEQVIYISGDTWNVNPIALKRVERLFCKNERAVVRTTLDAGGQPVTLVAVAAILVASIRLHCLDTVRSISSTAGRTSCPAMRSSAKATSSAGSSMDRPSSSLRRKASRCATTFARARQCGSGEPLMRLP